MIDKVPGSDAAAPSPITTRPAISMLELGATAPITDPAQNTTTPRSMTRLRPKKSPSVPPASMNAANVRA